MNSQPPQYNHSLFRHSVLIACLIHLIVFSMFIFTFPLIKQAAKPRFIFWGSILTKQDVRKILLTGNPTKIFSSESSHYSDIKDLNTIRPHTYPEKVTTPARVQREEKVILKSLFDVEPLAETIPRLNITEGIKEKVNLYNPLKWPAQE